MNDKFYMLNLPVQLRTGVWDGKWVVGTSHEIGRKPYGYLHSDNEVYETWFNDGHTSVIFETRLDALIETQAYYQHRSENFPYGKELNDEFIKFTAGCSGTRTIESQPMIFK